MNPKTSLTIEGGILGIIGFILFFDFISVDAYIFDFNPPAWAIRVSQIFEISPLMIDLLSTIGIILLVLMMRTEKQMGRMEA